MRHVVLAVLAATALTACTVRYTVSAESGENTPVATPAGYASALSTMNAARAEAGLVPLTGSAELMSAAQTQLSHVVSTGQFSHTGPGGNTLGDRVRGAGFCMGGPVGENLAYGQQSADAAAAGWLQSPLHRANILAQGTDYYGLADAEGYYVMVIGSAC
ncbi:CAP domain-containing protein [Pseudoroseicyclus tamaricis]|uniref:CAP domain-containing protein n=1 Tax=Pseudoroseicyclus tamaricis TaxID=2705421 RepID=A0A6B2JSN6_9RHOB|nr:CAP domain-containing protein [Pseudoroseicyclus tamaricis]NDV01577.1 CAP domain-containing protein [Pseudoroseicyclus tamaricis]